MCVISRLTWVVVSTCHHVTRLWRRVRLGRATSAQGSLLAMCWHVTHPRWGCWVVLSIEACVHVHSMRCHATHPQRRVKSRTVGLADIRLPISDTRQNTESGHMPLSSQVSICHVVTSGAPLPNRKNALLLSWCGPRGSVRRTDDSSWAALHCGVKVV
jgi:hypothetical protein